MIKRFLILSLIAFFGCAWNGGAEAATYDSAMRQCREKMAENPPQIEVLVNYGKLKYDFSKNDAELAELFNEYNPDKPVKGRIHGFTDLSPNVAIDLNVSRERIGKRYICTIPKKVVVRAQFINPTVYIWKALSKGSCQYRLALRHEQTHLDIGFTAMTLLGRLLKKNLPDVVQKSGPRISLLSDDSNMATKMSQEYQRFLEPILNIFQNALIEEQGKLDTPENYKKEARLCY